MAKLKEWQKKVNWHKSNDIDRCCLTCKYGGISIDTYYIGSDSEYCLKHHYGTTKWNAVCDDWEKRK